MSNILRRPISSKARERWEQSFFHLFQSYGSSLSHVAKSLGIDPIDFCNIVFHGYMLRTEELIENGTLLDEFEVLLINSDEEFEMNLVDKDTCRHIYDAYFEDIVEICVVVYGTSDRQLAINVLSVLTFGYFLKSQEQEQIRIGVFFKPKRK